MTMLSGEQQVRALLSSYGAIDADLEEKLKWLFSDSVDPLECDLKSIARLRIYGLCGVTFDG